MRFSRLLVRVVAGVGWLATLSHAASVDRPNIVIILADDLGYSDIGCFGGEIRTPNIDRLAANGIRFSQMYNTAKCYPTRACLLTGLYYQRTDRNFRGTTLLGELLRPAGYHTLWSGKHHATFSPLTRGYERFYGLLGGAQNHFNPGTAPIAGQPAPAFSTGEGNRWSLDGRDVDDFIPADPAFYDTDAFTDRALRWLDEYRTDGRPFLLHLAYTAPHWPLQAWPDDIARYRGVYDAGPEAVRDARYARQVKMGLVDPRTAALPAFADAEPEGTSWHLLSPHEREQEARKMEVYAAMVDRLDQNIGRLLARLEEHGQLDNTLILFLSDNGADRGDVGVDNADPHAPLGSVASFVSYGQRWATVSNTPLRRWKSDSFEGGICTPLVAHWPARIRPQAGWNREPCHVIDIVPTVLEAAGVSTREAPRDSAGPPLDGISLLPAFRGQPLARPAPMFFQFNEGSAVRDGRWKLVRSGSTWELYDIDTDRTETRDLAQERPELVQELGDRWLAWWKDCKGSDWTGRAPADKRR